MHMSSHAANRLPTSNTKHVKAYVKAYHLLQGTGGDRWTAAVVTHVLQYTIVLVHIQQHTYYNVTCSWYTELPALHTHKGELNSIRVACSMP